MGKPKPYVFVSYRVLFLLILLFSYNFCYAIQVDYIMIVATYESIEIFSIEDDNGMLVLKPTDFILATDGVIVRSVSAFYFQQMIVCSQFYGHSCIAQRQAECSLVKTTGKSSS